MNIPFISGPKIYYLGGEVVSLSEFRTELFVSGAVGIDAVTEYVDARVAGKPQLDSFIKAFGHMFNGKPDALLKACAAFEETDAYKNEYSDAVKFIADIAARDAKKLADAIAAADIDSAQARASAESDRESFEFMRDSQKRENERRAAEYAQMCANVNDPNGYTFV